MCSVMYRHQHPEEYAVSIMKADEIFFSSHNKERFVPGLVTENTLALCETGFEVLVIFEKRKTKHLGSKFKPHFTPL